MSAKREWLPREIARRCVFCGGQPSNRNREHVLPQWLLQLTGDPRRVVPLACNWETGEQISFSWNSFTAPACTTCNDSFSELEGAASVIVRRLLAGDDLTGQSVDVLLRWLDKVRVGLWLISNVLGGGPLSVEPTFAIRDRMDAADRAVIVVRTSGPAEALTVIGVGLPMFRFMPSCIGIVINGLALINVSAVGLLGDRSGFPWLDVQRIAGNGQLESGSEPETIESDHRSSTSSH
jgi:hypothetical protein